MSRLSDLAREIVNDDLEIKSINDRLDELKKNREELQMQLIQEMQEQDLNDFSVDNIGKRFTMKEDLYANVLVQDKPQLFEYLTDNGYSSLIKTDVNAKTFNSFIKEVTQGGQEELPDELKDIVSIYKKPKISITKKG